MPLTNNPGCSCCGGCEACTNSSRPNTWDITLPDLVDIPGGWGLTSECGAGDCAAGGIGGTYNLARVDNIDNWCVWRSLFTNPYTCIPGSKLGIELRLGFNTNGVFDVLGLAEIDIAFCDSWPPVRYEGSANLDTDVYLFSEDLGGTETILRAGWDYQGPVSVSGANMSIKDDYDLIAGTTGADDSTVKDCNIGSETTFSIFNNIFFGRYDDDGSMFGARQYFCAWPGTDDAANTHQIVIEPAS